MESPAGASMLWSLTDLGDLAVLLPLAAILFVWLLAQPARSKAWWWLVSVAFCAGATALFKIYFGSCPPFPDLRSPSGHTSFSTLVFGAFVTVIAFRLRGYSRVALIACATGLVIGIAASRTALNMHSLTEVVFGEVIGVVALAFFVWRYAHPRPTDRALNPLVVAAVMLVIILHGHELHAEKILQAISADLYARGTLSCG
jgi:membrane-associated phospholipid phosphatase